ncbi:aspartate/glutamate racemase family protein [Arthrobacter sp. SAFR-179]|uniref:aspartate/glutamate racemase family protein n=1 Tax=Arthrobacter sp. SAFR-179 TaxID=3387279 RepID=UPI003F7C7D69
MQAVTEPSRLVGILGGMGPSATADFYTKLIAHTPASVDQEHLRVVIWADPTVPNRQEAILAGGKDPSPWLETGIEKLIRSGAEIIVVPCNTVHKFLPPLMNGKPIEFISIIETTIDAVQRHTLIGPIGLLATDGALAAGIYQEALGEAGFDVALPSPEEQALLMEVVHQVKAGLSGSILLQDMYTVLASLKRQGARAAVVGCTELSTLLSVDSEGYPVKLIDPAAELAIATINRAIKHPSTGPSTADSPQPAIN